jgi:hypothetical protein
MCLKSLPQSILFRSRQVVRRLVAGTALARALPVARSGWPPAPRVPEAGRRRPDAGRWHLPGPGNG